MSTKPVFSICIPTYNRAQTLKTTLERITSDPDFDSRTEIVISDNCSPDNTRQIVEEFMSRFPNIVYSRNDENIGYRNFYKALTLGSGEYVKLQNDYASFTPGSLGRILSEIERHLTSREQLVFCQNTIFPRKETLHCTNADEFLNGISCRITWIINFGTWKEMLPKIEQPYQFSDLLLDQVDWSIQVAAKKTTILFIDDFYVSRVDNILKSGYNFFEVFLDNYFTILLHHKRLHHITQNKIEREKKTLYEHQCLHYLYYIKVKKTCALDTKGALGILWRNYHSYLYFYTIPLKLIGRHVYFKARNMLRL